MLSDIIAPLHMRLLYNHKIAKQLQKARQRPSLEILEGGEGIPL